MATEPPPEPGFQLTDAGGAPTRDAPWIFRTYAGHSSPRASNALYRDGLERGQTGLSIAFDLPTQCGYSSDAPIARPEVGKVGVPINSLDDFHVLFDGIPLERMNTSMTINGTAMWLLALYVALARERGVPEARLRGTIQNDIVKEYLARGTYIFPPAHSLRLVAETYEYCVDRLPEWNPSNVCSYHLQEAGATPVQEVGFALATAVDLLDRIAARGRIDRAAFARCVGRLSFFVNSGIRFVEEMCKMRAFAELWDELTRSRYGIDDPKLRLFRYGVQVNSLGLTEAQPENNAWRILIEALGVTLSRKARCRALQLPAWNEALSLPRPWDQQWALRLQQILAYETDLLEYPDLFDGNPVIAAKTQAIADGARAELEQILAMGGVQAAIEAGYMKQALVRSMTERITRITSGAQPVVGVNRWTDGLASPLTAGGDGGVFTSDPAAVEQALAALDETRRRRDPGQVAATLAALVLAARRGDNLMEPSIACALARVTTGEWAEALRGVFGEYRAVTGVDGQRLDLPDERAAALRAQLEAFVAAHGRRPRLVVGKPGLDGHSNGAEVIAVAARHAGWDVIYAGIRLAPDDIAVSAVEEDADLIGVSILSGSHLELTAQLMAALAARGGADIPVVVGGIVPKADLPRLTELGVRAVFTPADFDLAAVLARMAELIGGSAAA
ncbi:MAG: protein meaA [Kofleriaceae bacterium]|jgi:(2R)-ethylmalonyl-CoA mutase|nr:protein meaA [Kofleriaceae bacterium]MBP9169820.1 protein meaA [Kofleriaceae bacterium]MBP9858089.1 protein meaA [Kofleriaceae bacterium]